jgi:hypothetical protein
MSCKTNPSEAQEFFERMYGQRPAEPHANNEDPETWAEISNWDWKRAEFFSYMMIYDDMDIAYRQVQ